MVSNHRDSVKRAIKLLHHCVRVTRPPTHKYAFRRELLLQNVATAAVGVFDPDLCRPSFDCPFACRHTLSCHTLGEFCIVPVRLGCLVAMCLASNPLDIHGDEHPT
jgi:hypothetical protein